VPSEEASAWLGGNNWGVSALHQGILVLEVEVDVEALTAARPCVSGEAFAGGPLNGFMTKTNPETIASATNMSTE
jgi:hypothetical protein